MKFGLFLTLMMFCTFTISDMRVFHKEFVYTLLDTVPLTFVFALGYFSGFVEATPSKKKG